MQSGAFVFALFFSATVINECLSYPGGAPAGQCENMTPNHGSPAQTGASPYEIKVMKSYYTPGQNFSVYIESSSDNIKGFLIQARKVGENSAIGTFTGHPQNTSTLSCGNEKVDTACKW